MKVISASPRNALCIFIRDGFVQRVSSNSPALEDMDVAVVVDGEPEKLIRVGYEAEITAYVAGARAKSQCFMLGAEAEVVAEAFLAIAHRAYEAPRAIMADVEAVFASWQLAVARVAREI